MLVEMMDRRRLYRLAKMASIFVIAQHEERYRILLQLSIFHDLVYFRDTR